MDICVSHIDRYPTHKRRLYHGTQDTEPFEGAGSTVRLDDREVQHHDLVVLGLSGDLSNRPLLHIKQGGGAEASHLLLASV